VAVRFLGMPVSLPSKEDEMEDKIVSVVVGLLFVGYFSYVLYSGFSEKSLSFKGVNFSLEEKPFFFGALMFLAAFMLFAGVAGILDSLSK
jgi:hypothetical protein